MADASRSTTRTYRCPRCGASQQLTEWSLVDGASRPDLVERAIDGTLLDVRCRACADEIAVDVPLLVWRPERFPQLVFVAGDGREDEARADAQQLHDQLAAALPDDPTVGHGVVVQVDRAALGTVLRRDVAADARAHRCGDLELPAGDPYRAVLDGLPSWAEHGDDLPVATLVAQGEEHLSAGRAKAAVAAFDAARDRATVGSGYWVRATHNLGIALAELREGDRRENIEAAIACYDEVLPHCSRDDDPHAWAMVQTNLGNAYRRRIAGPHAANVEQAIAHHVRALEVFEATGDVRQAGLVRSNLATAYLQRDFGDRTENRRTAVRLAREAAPAIDREGDDVAAAVGWMTLGGALLETDDAALAGEAETCFRNAAERYEAAGRRQQAATARLNRALALRALGPERRDEAIAVLHEALGDLHDAPLEWASATYNLAQIHRDAGDDDSRRLAIDLLRASLGVLTPDAHALEARDAASLLAVTLAEAGDWHGAAAALGTALAAADRAYDATALSAVREAELTRSGPLHHRAGYARARAGDLDGAVAALERGRAHWLAAALRADDVAGRLPDDLSAADRARLDEALRELREVARLERAFGTFEDMPLRGGEDPLERRARDALATIEELTGVSPGTDVASLAGHLGEGEGLVYLATTAWGSVAILIDGGGARAAFADDLDNAAIGSLVGDGPPRYLAGLLGDTAALDARLEPVLVQLEQTLGALLAGLARERGLRRLTLIPTGLLGLVPLHAMPCAGAQPLLEEIEIAYAPSALSWRVARSRAAAATPDLAFLGVANPLPTDAPLLLAGAEVETIADGFDEALVLAEGDATKAAVHEATPRATHVHLACHGEYDPDRPLATHLKLADGGTLTLHELLDRADFAGVRLVTAIACQSAMTRLDRAPDEVLGFPAGFLSAGAAGVVAALWPVEDLPAALVATQLFARQRDGLAPAAALAAAERWLRTATNADVIAYLEQHPRLAAAARVWIALAAAAPGTRPYEHPRHWAAYVLVGA